MDIDFKKYETDDGWKHAILAKENIGITFIREKLAKILGMKWYFDIDIALLNTFYLYGAEERGQETIECCRYVVFYKDFKIKIDEIVEDYDIEEIPFAFDIKHELFEYYISHPEYMASYFNVSEEEIIEIAEKDKDKLKDMASEFARYTRYKQFEENDFLIDNFNKQCEY